MKRGDVHRKYGFVTDAFYLTYRKVIDQASPTAY